METSGRLRVSRRKVSSSKDLSTSSTFPDSFREVSSPGHLGFGRLCKPFGPTYGDLSGVTFHGLYGEGEQENPLGSETSRTKVFEKGSGSTTRGPENRSFGTLPGLSWVTPPDSKRKSRVLIGRMGPEDGRVSGTDILPLMLLEKSPIRLPLYSLPSFCTCSGHRFYRNLTNDIKEREKRNTEKPKT